VVPQYGPLSIYIKLDSLSIANFRFIFPLVWPLVDFKAPKIFMVMALGPCANQPSVSQDSQVKLCNNKIFERNPRMRACDHYTSNTLIGGKGGAGPSSPHTMLAKYVIARWM
jgi:hypothetical protein